MGKWLRRIRGALGMGLMWAVGWGLVVGGVMEGIVDPRGVLLDMWPQTLAIPGFLCGVGFAVVLRVAGGRRRFDELSLPRFAAWGGVAGLLVGAFVVVMLFGNLPLTALAAIIASTTGLSAVSASGSLALARMAEERDLLDAG